jgi:hypothetical protein
LNGATELESGKSHPGCDKKRSARNAVRILQAHGTIIPGRKELVSCRRLGFAFAGGGRPKPELASAIHDVVSILKCIVKTGLCASLDLTFRAIFGKSVLLAKMGTIEPQVLKALDSR